MFHASWPPRGSCPLGLLTLASLGLAAREPLQAGTPCFPKLDLPILCCLLSPLTASVYPPTQLGVKVRSFVHLRWDPRCLWCICEVLLHPLGTLAAAESFKGSTCLSDGLLPCLGSCGVQKPQCLLMGNGEAWMDADWSAGAVLGGVAEQQQACEVITSLYRCGN